MNVDYSIDDSNEIDLRNIFFILFAYKFLIVFVCLTTITIGGFYALSLPKNYTSSVLFKMDQSKSTFSSSGDIMLTKLAGLPLSNGSSIIPIDKANGRVFIEKLDKQLDFKNDPYFNAYNPDSIEPFWKAELKKLIGWENIISDIDEIIWQSIVSTFLKNVKLHETESGNIKILVKHENALRAATIANAIMKNILKDEQIHKNEKKNSQLNYFSETLATAKNELEQTQSDLKRFALENSALPFENFAAGSVQLDILREKLIKTSELYDAILELEKITRKKDLSEKKYLSLRLKHPVIDHVEFRRVLGQNEIIGSWSWPLESTVRTVRETLSQRKKMVQSQIDKAQKDTKRFSNNLENYGKLQRKLQVAEATYEVLLEQVKAATIIAGFSPDNSEIFEFASPSIIASEPKRIMILAISGLLGLSMGCLIAFLLSIRRAVFFSKQSLITFVRAQYTANAKALKFLRKRNLVGQNKLMPKDAQAIFRDLAVEIHKDKSNQIVITSAKASLKSIQLACALGSYMESTNLNVAIIDFSNKENKSKITEDGNIFGSFIENEKNGKVSILMPNNKREAIEFLSKQNFSKEVFSLNNKFDLIFVCADDTDAITLLRAIQGQKFFHIALAKTKYTKFISISQTVSLFPVQGLLYE